MEIAELSVIQPADCQCYDDCKTCFLKLYQLTGKYGKAYKTCRHDHTEPYHPVQIHNISPDHTCHHGNGCIIGSRLCHTKEAFDSVHILRQSISGRQKSKPDTQGSEISQHTPTGLGCRLLKASAADDGIGPYCYDQGCFRKIGEANHHIGSQADARNDKHPVPVFFQSQIQADTSCQKQNIRQIIIQNCGRTPAQTQCHDFSQKGQTGRNPRLFRTEQIPCKCQPTWNKGSIEVHSQQRVCKGKLRYQMTHGIGKIRREQPHGIHMLRSHVHEITIVVSCIPQIQAPVDMPEGI